MEIGLTEDANRKEHVEELCRTSTEHAARQGKSRLDYCKSVN